MFRYAGMYACMFTWTFRSICTSTQNTTCLDKFTCEHVSLAAVAKLHGLSGHTEHEGSA